MSEPRTTADAVEEVLPGVWRWAIHDERIDFLGAAYAFATGDGTVMVDPEPLAPEVMHELGRVEAIVLTSGSHQRAAWRYRRELGVRVWAPALVREVDEEPDIRYGEGDPLPGDMRAVFTPGAGTTQHTLVRDGIAIISDLLLQNPDGSVAIVPDRYLHDPDEARRSLRRLLELPFAVALLTHGGVLRDPKTAIASVLESGSGS
jgi:hypothetical protein